MQQPSRRFGCKFYTTLQAAHDAAVAGDIIYLEPSQFDYGAVDIRKRLTIIGTGYFLKNNGIDYYGNRSSLVLGITFNQGSANSTLTGVEIIGTINIFDVNISVTRCKTGSMAFGSSSNAIAGVYSRGNSGSINKCLIFGAISGFNSSTITTQWGYNCAITNNIIQMGIGGMTNSVITNNTFSSSATFSLFACSFSNNILDKRIYQGGTIYFVDGGSGNTIFNNICLGASAIPTGNGNVSVSYAEAELTFLVSDPWTTSFGADDSKFQLAASGSPATGIGSGGTDAGAFGGGSPYVLSGLPAYPVITNYTVSGTGNSTVPLNVSVTVRGNN